MAITAFIGSFLVPFGTTATPSKQSTSKRLACISRLAAASTIQMSTASKKTALVVTNKGGGHGELGFHLAKDLAQKGFAVELVTDHAGKGEDSLKKKLPFSKYDELVAAGIICTFTDLSKMETPASVFKKDKYAYVFDNENVVQDKVALFAASAGAFYSYVSSGGMYVPGTTFPMPESNATKDADANEQKKHEMRVMDPAVRSKLRGCAFFRPQYIVGPYTNKRDYLDWYFDRIVRDMPIPLPAPGTQLTTVTDARDVASMIAAVVDAEEKILQEEKNDHILGPVFNCASDLGVSLTGIARSCGRAAGKTDAQIDKLIKYFDPKKMKTAPSGGKFPFRASNFNVGVDKAKHVLGWKTKYSANFDALAEEYFAGYKALGLDDPKKVISSEYDAHVLAD